MFNLLRRLFKGEGKKMDLGRSPVAVVIIDMQPNHVRFLVSSDRELLIKNHTELIRYCAKLDIPVMILEYGSDDADDTIIDLWEMIRGVRRHQIVGRWENDGFSNSELSQVLRGWGVKHLLLAGINADACVMDTAKGALKHDFKIATAANLIANDHAKPINERWYKKHGKYGPDWKPILRKLLAE